MMAARVSLILCDICITLRKPRLGADEIADRPLDRKAIHVARAAPFGKALERLAPNFRGVPGDSLIELEPLYEPELLSGNPRPDRSHVVKSRPVFQGGWKLKTLPHGLVRYRRSGIGLEVED